MPTSFKLKTDSNVITRLQLVPEQGKPPVLEEQALASLEQALTELEANPPGVLVVESTVEKFFCLGADLKILRETTEETIVPWVKRGHAILNRLEDLPCPTLARVSGYAMGGGLELAMACDFILAHDSARFAQSEAGIGFIPGWGGTFRLPERIGTESAKYYFYTGEQMDAVTALKLGLVRFVGTSDEVEQEIQRMARLIEKNSRPALSSYKRIVQDQRSKLRSENAEIEAESSRACAGNPDTQQRITNFFNRKS
jgi:enoyl-CoA hydratase